MHTDNNTTLFSKHRIQGSLVLAYNAFPRLFEQYVDESKIALDYGCGTGRSSRYLEDMGFKHIDGVDISESMINTAKDLNKYKSSSVHYTTINSPHIEQRAAKYDLIFSTLVFLEIPTIDEMQNIVNAMYEATKFNGTVIILTASDNFHQYDWISAITQLSDNKKEIKSGDEVYFTLPEVDNLKLKSYYWRDEDYRQVFTKAGFIIAEHVLPKARGDENIEWVNEVTHAPYAIYVLKKEKAQQATPLQLQNEHFTPMKNGAWLKKITADAQSSIAEILMPAKTKFNFHQVASKETFTYITGSDLTIHLIEANGQYTKVYLGIEHDNARQEFIVPAHTWFAEEVEAKSGYAQFTAKNEPAFDPNAYITLTDLTQLPENVNLTDLSAILMTFSDEAVKTQLYNLIEENAISL